MREVETGFPEDTTLIANSEEELSKMAEQLREVSEDKGLLINNSKTSCMNVHGEGND